MRGYRRCGSPPRSACARRRLVSAGATYCQCNYCSVRVICSVGHHPLTVGRLPCPGAPIKRAEQMDNDDASILAAACSAGAFPSFACLMLSGNAIGNVGLAALLTVAFQGL